MATTAFSTLYPYLRVALGDIHPTITRYSDAMLKGILQYALLQDADHSESPAEEVDPALTKAGTGLLVVNAAIATLSPQNVKSFRTRMLSVNRETGQHLANLRGLKRLFENDGVALAGASYNDTRQWFEGMDLLYDLIMEVA